MSRIVSNQTQNAAGEQFYIPATTDIQSPYGGVNAGAQFVNNQIFVTPLDANLQQTISFLAEVPSTNTIVDLSGNADMPIEGLCGLTILNYTDVTKIEVDLAAGLTSLVPGTFFYIVVKDKDIHS
jgi:hypothetical protein